MITNIEKITPSPIQGATVEKIYTDGNTVFYSIHPNEGYMLHDNARDSELLDPVTGERTFTLGYTTNTVNCSAYYDFTPVIITDEGGATFTGYGSRGFFAIPIKE